MSDDTDNLRDVANYLYIKGGTSDKVREIRGAADLIDQLRADLLASQERARLLLGSNESLMSALTIATQAEVEARKELAASQLECERVREALIGYGQHDDDCAWNSDRVKDGATFCSCGLTKALSTPQSPDALAAHDTALLHKAAEELTNVDHESCQMKFDVKHACVDVLLNMAAEREPKP